MKKTYLLFLSVLCFTFLSGNKAIAQTASTTVNYTGFQACGGCTVCGSDYWCFNTLSSYCGNTVPCQTKTFFDPCPAGNIVTSVTVNYFSADCSGGSMTATIDGQAVPTVNEGNTGCLCSNSPCAQSATSSNNYPCGLPGYVNGGNNTLQMCTGANVCINRVVLVFTYAPANQATPAVTPSTPSGPTSVCAGTSYNYSASSSNASGYTWTVPAGWTINSGQGTGSINATPGGAGNICVTAYNLCGSSAPACLAVNISTPSSAPTGASASPNPICPGNTTTLTESGGSLGVGANWNWYTGGCGGTFIGSGSSITVSPVVATTYYVAAVGTCNSTACANVTVNVNGIQATPGAPSGSTSVCNGSNQVYSTTGSAGATSYNWTVPGGAVINSGQGTSSINVTLGASSGNICVDATGPCGTSAPACTAITITSVPLAPVSITGTTPVCPGNQNYSIGAVGGATGYTWGISGAGGTITGGQGTTGISTNWSSAVLGSITVTADNACGSSAAATFNVTVLDPSVAPSGASATPNPICPSTPTTLSVSGGSLGSGASWNWYTGGCGGTLIGSGASISVSPAISTTYYVGAVGTCNSTACSNVTVNVNGTTPTPGTPTGNSTPCNGGTENYSTTGSAGATSYTWSVPAGAVINSGQGTTSISVTLGSSSGNICVTATGPCGTSAAACAPLTISTVPLAPTSITGTTPVCPGNQNYTTGAVAGATGYTWVLNGAGGSITGGQGTTGISTTWSSAVTGVVSVTADNVCGSSSAASFTVLVNPLPNVSITASPASICSGGSTTLTGGGAVNYSWLGGTIPAAGTVVNASPATTSDYTVTGTDANNCVNTASITITVNPTPTVSITSGAPSQTVCAGGSVTGITFSSTPAGSISWTNSNTGLGGPLSSPSGAGNIPGYTAPIVGAVTTGVITIDATAGGTGCPSTGATSATFTLTINPQPAITGSVVTAAPCGLNTGCINSVTASGAPTIQFSWDAGATWSVSSSTCNIPSGTYPIEIQDGNGCILNSSIFVPSTSGPSAPTVTSPTTAVCAGSNVPLSLTSPIGTYTYTWTDASGSTTTTSTSYTVNNISPAGTYTVTIYATDATGCLGTATTITITVNGAPTPPTLGGSVTNPLVECQGVSPQAVTVTPTGTITAVPVWYNGSTYVTTGLSYSPSTAIPGTTVYTIIDSATVTGCINSSAGNVLTVTVTINPSPTAPTLGGSLLNPVIECQGSVAQTITVVPTGTPTTIPVWYNGPTYVTSGTTYTPSTAIPGTTIYTIADSVAVVGGCSSASTGNVLTVTVTINQNPTAPVLTGTVTNPITECQGSSQSVTVATTGTVTSIPVWYQGTTYLATGTSYTPNSSVVGTTVYTVIDSATVTGCKDASAASVLSVTVTVIAAPTANTAGLPDSSNCGLPTGGVTGVTASGGTAPLHYQWYNGSTLLVGDTLPNLTGVSNGTYSVLITDANGCPALGGITTFTVSSATQVAASFTTNTLSGLSPLPVTFTNTSTGATTYTWTFGDGSTSSTVTSPSYIYNLPGTYTAVLIASNGTCADTAYATIIVDIPTSIVIPNVFSPNGDSLNDEFIIRTTGMKSLHCEIFNRWGQKVFTLTGPNQSWDGRLNNGLMATEGTYYYMLVAVGDDTKTYTYQGPLTLVK